MTALISKFSSLHIINYNDCEGWMYMCSNVIGVYYLCHSSRPRAEQSLVRWATPQLHDIDALSKMVDPALKGLYPVKSLSRFADVIALCVQVPCLIGNEPNFKIL